MLADRIRGYRIILGSASPRRRELLAGLGLTFDVAVPAINEEVPSWVEPREAASWLARAKADSLREGLGSRQILITADTIVLCSDRILPKPGNRDEAVEFLRFLSGKVHSVITGVCITTGSSQVAFSSETLVKFCQIDDEEIDYYADNYHPYDKAGAYGIQEWIGFVATERIEGSYFNVMGLPVNRLYRELKKLFK
ncbi:MAG: septum formation protein Maf [Bacteroidetes bacterium]|nr:septum formation protein Maf [Bacteroidota bacterium]